MIYNNIKYILTNDLKLSIEYIENDYDNAINDFNCRLENNENDIESLDITYVAASASFDDKDPYPIASDHESMIVKNLIQIFGVMRQAREDMTNDNLK